MKSIDKTNRAIDRIDEIEERYVIKNVKLVDGTIESIETVDENVGDIVEVEIIGIEEHEANGFDVEILNGKWIKF